MNRSVISQRIASILDDIERLNNELYAVNSTDIQRYPDNYEVLSTHAALQAERIACRMRHIIYATSKRPKRFYLTSAAETLGIQITQSVGVLKITSPA